MHRFFEENPIIDDILVLKPENLKHIKVLRIQDDEVFEIVLNEKIYEAKMLDDERCKIISQKEINSESPIKIYMYQGLPKSDKLELIIQKATELGVSSVTPFTSSRTIVKWDNKKESKKLKRYEEIAESASKQSKRIVIPKINELISFNELINISKDRFTIVAYENRGITIKETIKLNNTEEFNIIIGPEGGFSEDEILKLEDSGAYIVNLGNRILRTETAAIALVSMIQYEAGDIN